MVQNERVALWDNLKFFLILCVVVGHFARKIDSQTYTSLCTFLYSFHMALFIFISGLFHKNEKITEKVCAYLAIFFVFKIATWLLNTAFGYKPEFQLLTEEGTPWFMFAMAAFLLLTYLLRNMNPYFLLVLSILIACFAGYDDSINSYLVLSRILVFYPVYLSGVIFSGENRKRLERLNRNKMLKITAVLVILVWAVCCFVFRDLYDIFFRLFMGSRPYSDILTNAYGCLWRLLTYAIAAVIGFSLILAAPAKRLPVISVAGQRTLQIYFWHRMILYVFTNLGLHKVFQENLQGKILWLLLAVAVTLLTAWKIFSFPTGTIMKFQKKTGKNIENSR